MSVGRIAASLTALVAVLVSAELGGRYFFGLGNPPLYIRLANVDFMLKPNASYYRFGHEIALNSFGMRSREPGAKKEACELRFLAVGDSVVNGGAATDQAELATSILEHQLMAALNRPVWVGNASNGRWAPENMLAYLNRFGWHEPDVVVLVLNTADVGQRAAFLADMGSDFPTERPPFALAELIGRYLPALKRDAARLLAAASLAGTHDASSSRAGRDKHASPDPEAVRILASLVDAAKRHAAVVLIVHHREQGEEVPGDRNATRKLLADQLRQIAQSAGAYYVDFGPIEHNAALPRSPYRDWIHLNAFGQGLLADVMRDNILVHLDRVLKHQPPECRSVRVAA